ncbi:preprotein translocase subunit SecG [Mucilaginibacter robiniae]|uniref:Protein-export membrane protein SecG n=1 Tax=Mucilaginibacter robiniae TaxID=2728022 RepID=A0A7L5E2F0_9SPHI|nr:preprotein translocase subunit SecG [Mucilaginibacter robiniae]QJD96738.1 preprotein translocase subunit SecG [Mucilaginibacter robiniae]
MYIVLLIVAILVCVLLAIIVLVQNPKGGGLSSNFSSSSQMLGVQKTGDILEKGTWVLAIALMVLSLAINVAVKSGTASATGSSEYREQIQKASKPSGAVSTGPLSLPSATKPADTAKK